MFDDESSDVENEFDGFPDDDWGTFHDPQVNFLRQARYKDQKRTVREIEEIALPLDEMTSVGLDRLSTLEVPAPTDAESRRVVSETLITLSSIHDETLMNITHAGMNLSTQNVADFDTLRHKLMKALYKIVDQNDMDTFQLGEKQCIYRLERFMFRGVLQCQACILSDPKNREKVKDIKPQAFEILTKKKAIPRNLLTQPIVSFKVGDIANCIKYLESKWILIPYDNGLYIYLDLLMARLGIIISEPQREELYGNIEDYKVQEGDGLFDYSEKLMEDFCWSFVPMYKKIFYYDLIAKDLAFSIEISTEDRNTVEHMVTESARKLENKTLI